MGKVLDSTAVRGTPATGAVVEPPREVHERPVGRERDGFALSSPTSEVNGRALGSSWGRKGVRVVRAIGGLWRWRHNPLRRTTDLVEAWVALVALLLILVGTPVVGSVLGSFAQSSLQKSARDQQRTRHLVAATVVKKLNPSPVDLDPESSRTREATSRVLADWTAPDGTARHGTVLADLKSPHRGERFALWTDDQGRIVDRPLDGAAATTHAVLAGFGAAAMTAGLIEGGRRLIVWRLVLRRYARWDQAWDKAGPDWGRTGTGS